MTRTCSSSFLYLCVACWMRSLTVQPSLQGTTTPVCPNVTVTFITALCTSSKMQALWMWAKTQDCSKMQLTKSPPRHTHTHFFESLHTGAEMWPNRGGKDGWKECRATEWLAWGSKGENATPQGNFYRSQSVSQSACQCGPESPQLLSKTQMFFHSLSMPFPLEVNNASADDTLEFFYVPLITSHLFKQHPLSIDDVQLVHVHVSGSTNGKKKKQSLRVRS